MIAQYLLGEPDVTEQLLRIVYVSTHDTAPKVGLVSSAWQCQLREGYSAA